MPIDVQKTTASLNIIPNDIMQKKTEAIVAFFHLCMTINRRGNRF